MIYTTTLNFIFLLKLLFNRAHWQRLINEVFNDVAHLLPQKRKLSAEFARVRAHTDHVVPVEQTQLVQYFAEQLLSVVRRLTGDDASLLLHRIEVPSQFVQVGFQSVR